ncbi:MAG: diguanylate cyclase, partial [Candidatus Aminicenantes bacterium]|nr:diguanylate cyclase [Candidatus Aminicenantes bacterium]
KDGKFKTLKAEDGLASNIVFRTYEDSDNIMWISTSNGLSRYDHKSFFNYSEMNDLPESAIFQVIEDSLGRLWMISESGVHIINKSILNQIATGKARFAKVTLYNDLDGLLDSPTSVSWAIKSNDEMIRFPTLMGIALIDTLNIPINEKSPPLLIEMVQVDNKSYSPPQIKVLSPNYKRLTFAFTALSYVIPHKVQYIYKLEGFDENWSELTTKREVSYTTLPPGKYSFRVKAVNNDGIWNTGDVNVEFLQKPVFYKTLWFDILVVLILIGIIALFFGLRIRTLRKRGVELEKQVAERTAELQATDRLVANINKEIKIDKLLKVLLQQTMILFPQAERGVIFTYNRSNNTFEPKVSLGDGSEKIAGKNLVFDETFDRFLKNGKEYEDGIYIIDEFSKSPLPNKFIDVESPESVIAMTIMSGDILEGFFILGNMSNPDAFTQSDAKKMMRVREHTISAVFKARTHQRLEEAAIMDPLTKLHNRRKMIEVLENELIRTERTNQPFCIVMGDIDHFK